MIKADNEDIVGRMQQASVFLIEYLGLYSRTSKEDSIKKTWKDNILLQVGALQKLYDSLP